MSSTGIHAENLDKQFGAFHAVRDVSFTAADGSITAILGPSGSGKSTVLRIIAGLERPDSGRITIQGEEQSKVPVQERRVGFVFQHYALFRHMSVRDNVGFGLSVRRTKKNEIRKRVDELLELVQLEPFADRYPDQLSGGQRQRVALARALAARPRVLLLDEPFGALDARVREELRRWLDDLHREIKVTSLLVTHDQEEALELANEVVVMNHGRIEQIGSPDEVYNHPASPFVAGFIGSANVIEAKAVDGHLVFGGSVLERKAADIPHGGVADAFIRPTDVKIADAAMNGSAHRAVVERVNNLGSSSRVHLRLPDGQPLLAVLRNEDLPLLSGGAEVRLDLSSVKVFVRKDVEEASDSVPA